MLLHVPLRVNQNLLVLFCFVLVWFVFTVVAECLYASRNLPDLVMANLNVCKLAII